ncbi:MAG: hypothetical protein U5N21_24970 [Rhodococcus sp. (in: high G+C Gram-positive bacteria)]|nr:hypothetical protein [Rhodococcus sp. (in: high G+C Gram-positive bacteria)]
MATYETGQAAIRIVPNLTGFHKTSNAKLKERPLRAPVQLVPNLKGFTTDANTKIGALTLKPAKVQIVPDITGFGAALDTKLNAVHAEFDVQVLPDLTGFATELDAQLGAVPEHKLSVGLEVTAAEIQRFLAELQAHLSNADVRVPVRLDLDEGNYLERIAWLTRPRTQDITVSSNRSGIDRMSGSLGKMLTGLGGLVSAAAPITAIGFAAAGSVGPIGAMVAALGTAAGALAALPALGVAAGAGLAAVMIGANGVSGAFSAMGKSGGAAADTSKAVEAAQQRLASAERGVESAQRQSKRAQRDLNDARKEAAQRLRDMNDELANSALDEEAAVLAVERASQRLKQAKADRAKGDAEDIDVKEADLAYRQAIAAMEAQRKSANVLASETALANQAGVEGSREVVDAKQSVVDATQGEADAQRDLANAVRDLGDAASGAAGGVDPFAEAMEKLSANAQEFVYAMQALGPAWTDVRKSIQDDLFEGLGDSVTTLANVQLPVLKTGLGAIATEINGGLRSAIAQFSTDAAAMDFSTVLGNSAKMFSGVADAMAPLSQAFMDIVTVGSEFLGGAGAGISEWAQGFADTVSQMRADGSLQEMIQNGLDMLSKLGSMLSDVGGIITGVFGAAMDASGDTMAGLGQVLDMVNTFVNSVDGQDALGSFFSSITTAISAMMPILLQVADIVGTTVAPALSDMIVALGPGFDAFVGGLATGLEALAPAMGPLGSAIGSIGEALAPVLPMLGETLAGIITGLAPAVGPLADAFSALIAALLPILPPVAELIGQLVAGLAPALTALIDALAPLIENLMPILEQYWDVLADVLSQVAGILADGLVTAIEALAPLLPPLFDAWSQIVIAMLPLLPVLAELVVQLLPPFVQILQAILPVVTDVILIFADLVQMIVPVLIPVIEKLGEIFGKICGFIADSIVNTVDTQVKPAIERFTSGFEAAKNFIRDAADNITGFFSSMGEKIGKIWDGVVSGIKTAVGKVGELLKKMGGVTVMGVNIVPGGDKIKGLGDSLVSWSQSKATGGRVEAGRDSRGLLYGPGTGTSDSIFGFDENGLPTAKVSAGEMVIKETQTKKNLPLLTAINAGWTPPAELLHAMLPGFAGGGQVESMEKLVGQRWPSLLQGGHAFSSYRNSNDHHGSGLAADFSNGGDEGSPEMQELAAFIADNYLGQTLELIHSPFDRNIKNGEFVGDGMSFYGAGLMGQHRNHVHWAVAEPVGEPAPQIVPELSPPQTSAETPAPDPLADAKVPDTGIYADLKDSSATKDSGALPTMADIAADAARETTEGVFDFLGLKDTVFFDPNLSPIVRAMTATENARKEQNSNADAAVTAQSGTGFAPGTVASEVIPTFTDPVPAQATEHVYNPSLGVEQWDSTILQALEMMGLPASNLGRTREQVDIESGGDPEAINLWDINAQNGDPSIGLLQVIKKTFDAMVHPLLADRGQTDPLASLTAGLGWVVNRWGGPEQKWPTRAGYRNGGWIFGGGDGTSDSVPVDASTGEYMVREAKARQYGPVLEAINSGVMDQMLQASRAGFGGSRGGRDISLSIGEINTYSEPAAVREYRRAVRTAVTSDALA